MARITILPKKFVSSRARSCSGRVLRFEPLEDRRVLATFMVTNLNDATVTGPGNAPGTLRQAIFDANLSSDADTINFAPGLSGDLALSIASDATIGLSAFRISSPITIKGNAAGITLTRDILAPEMRYFRVAIGGDLTLDSINVTGGIARGTNGTAGQSGNTAYAGAIYNQGSLQIISSALYDNTAIGGSAGTGGNSGAGQGGALYNDGGNVTIRNSTFSGNAASNGFGPIGASSFGGNIYSNNGSLNIDNSTITKGTATSGRQIYIIGVGAGHTAIAQIRSSIIAQSGAQYNAFDLNATEDLGGQVTVTGSNNLIRRQNLFPSITVSSDDPQLGPLDTNGGPTRTHELLTGSPAIDQGSNPLNLANDQRGVTYARVVGGKADIGAYEVQTAGPALPGDYTRDQTVDAADFVLWRKTKGNDVLQYTGADGNGSSTIDDADYDVWRGNFGAQAFGAATVDLDLQPIAERAQPSTEPLLAVFSESTSDYSAKSDGHDGHWPLATQRSLPINRRNRDEALLAIIAGQFPASSAPFEHLCSTDDHEPDATSADANSNLLPRDKAFLSGELINRL